MRGALLLLAACFALPVVLAQAAGGPVTLLVYHAPGGPEPDPLATPLAPPPAGAERLPATFVDGVERASNAPEGTPESAPAHYRELQRLLGRREGVPPGATLRIEGELAPGALELAVGATGEPRAATLTLVVFEHKDAPYAARFALSPVEMTLPGNVTQSVRLDPAWDPERLGVVAILRDPATGEALQSATWLVRGDAPVTQEARAVLVEHVTASWCEPCRPADDALALLAEQRGPAGGLDVEGSGSYLRAPTWRLWLGLALGGAAGIALVRRSRA